MLTTRVGFALAVRHRLPEVYYDRFSLPPAASFPTVPAMLRSIVSPLATIIYR
jgi:hypothetical protein